MKKMELRERGEREEVRWDGDGQLDWVPGKIAGQDAKE